MSLDSSEIRGVYFDNCLLKECSFVDCKIRASMFDGAFLANCSIINCNMRNLNIEFATIQNCDLSGTTISYYQLPYIIGIFSNSNIKDTLCVGIHNTETIPMDQYLKNINDSIVYFTSLEEYFPLANLYYAKKENEIAYNCIFNGIDKALLNNDIRMRLNLSRGFSAKYNVFENRVQNIRRADSPQRLRIIGSKVFFYL